MARVFPASFAGVLAVNCLSANWGPSKSGTKNANPDTTSTQSHHESNPGNHDHLGNLTQETEKNGLYGIDSHPEAWYSSGVGFCHRRLWTGDSHGNPRIRDMFFSLVRKIRGEAPTILKPGCLVVLVLQMGNKILLRM